MVEEIKYIKLEVDFYADGFKRVTLEVDDIIEMYDEDRRRNCIKYVLAEVLFENSWRKDITNLYKPRIKPYDIKIITCKYAKTNKSRNN